jgi:tetratricopeptide (TPR) repeat protein
MEQQDMLMSDSSPTEVVYISDEPFFGRVKQQERFREVLGKLRDISVPQHTAGQLPFIMLIYGDGGIGKTRLLRRFEQIMRETMFTDQFQLLWIDWDDHRHLATSLRNGHRRDFDAEIVLDPFHHRAATDLKLGSQTPKDAYKELKEKRATVEQKVAEQMISFNLPSSQGTPQVLTTRDLALLLRREADLPHLCRLLGVEHDALIVQQLLNRAETWLRAKLTPNEFELFRKPQQDLARALGTDLRELSTTQPLVIMMDTYEVVDQADEVFRTVVQASGPRVTWIIAGRNDLLTSRQDETGYIRGYDQDFATERLIAYDIGELACDEVKRYFALQVPNMPLDDKALSAITQVTRGIPLAVRLAAQIYQQEGSLDNVIANTGQGIPAPKIVHEMTIRYMRYCLQNPTDLQALYMLALADGNEQVLQALQLEENTGLDFHAYMRRLERNYASVYRHGGRDPKQSYQLHEAPALYLREHLRQQSNEPWLQTYIDRAVTTLRRALDQLESELLSIEERCHDDAEGGWIPTTVELARYLLWQPDDQQALQWIVPRFVEGLAYNAQLANSLVELLNTEHKLLGELGKRWLEALHTAGTPTYVPPSEEHLHIMLNESNNQASNNQRYLNGTGEQERRAIIALRQGAWCVTHHQYAQAQQHYDEAERSLPNGGSKLRERLARQWRTLGSQLNQQQQWAQAKDVLNRSLALHAEDDRSLHERGVAYHNLGDFMQALADFDRSLTLDPDNPDTLGNRGWTYHTMRDYAQALADYGRSLALRPDHAIVLSNRGQTYYAVGKYVQALVDFDRSLELDPNSSTVLSNRGSVYRDQGKYERALEDYHHSLEIDSNDPATHSNRGQTYYAMGEYMQALRDYTRSLELDPDNPVNLSNRGQTHYAMGEYTQALADYTRSLDLRPDDPFTLNERGLTYQATGSYNQALADFDRCLELCPEHAFALFNRGQTYFTIGNYNLALADFSSSLELRSDSDETWNERGGVYHTLGEFAKAVADYTRSLELDPNDPVTLLNRGRAYSDQGEFAKAVADYTRSLELDPNNPITLQWRARSYHAMGAYVQALEGYNRSLDLVVDDPVTLHQRGLTHHALGEYIQALADYNRSLELRPEHPLVLINRGTMSFEQGEYAQALADYNQAITVTATSPDPRPYTSRGICYAYMGRYEQAQDDFAQAQQIGTHLNGILLGQAVASALQQDAAATLDYLRQALIAHASVWQAAHQGYHYDHAFVPLCESDSGFAATFNALLHDFKPAWAAEEARAYDDNYLS